MASTSRTASGVTSPTPVGITPDQLRKGRLLQRKAGRDERLPLEPVGGRGAAARFLASQHRLPAGREVDLVGAEVPNVVGGEEDIEVTVYTWPAFGVASEARLGLETTGGDTWLKLAASGAYGAVMRAFPGLSQQFAVFTQPIVERVASFTTEESLPLGLGAFSPDDQYAAFLVMHWWSSGDDRLVGQKTDSILWATIHLVHLRDRHCSHHPVFVRPPPQWQPGEELEKAAYLLAQAPHSLRFEDATSLVFDVPWGGQGRVTMPPPPEGILAPAPTVTTPQ